MQEKETDIELPSRDVLYAKAAAVLDLGHAKGLTVGTAESCTGGLVSGALTAVPGSSSVVRGGITSYAIPVKHEVLGVPSAILDAPGIGAVSFECAEAMAKGARRVLSCDAAVSITGIAGPGGEEPGKPVGTVWFGLATGKGVRSERHLFSGDRREVRLKAIMCALGLLEEGLEEL